jgi:hypothetical protein
MPGMLLGPSASRCCRAATMADRMSLERMSIWRASVARLRVRPRTRRYPQHLQRDLPPSTAAGRERPGPIRMHLKRRRGARQSRRGEQRRWPSAQRRRQAVHERPSLWNGLSTRQTLLSSRLHCDALLRKRNLGSSVTGRCTRYEVGMREIMRLHNQRGLESLAAGGDAFAGSPRKFGK